MFKIFKMEASMKYWRRSFCDTEGDYQKCARYDGMLAGRIIPDTLLPNGSDLRLTHNNGSENK